MKTFDKYLKRKNAEMPAEHLAILKKKKSIPVDQALHRENINKLFEAGYLEGENGYCRLKNGCMYTSVLTKMPKVTLDMINWWFWWHAKEGIRYQIWYPEKHFDIQSDFGGYYDDETMSYAERLHKSSHLVTEDVGMGKEEILIDFKNPVDFGLDSKKLNDQKNTVICARVGSPGKGLWFVDMCHFVRKMEIGVEMRSRFWMGHNIEKMKGLGRRTISKLLNLSFVKGNLIPMKAGSNMFHHCSQEYHNMAEFLPEIYKEKCKVN